MNEKIKNILSVYVLKLQWLIYDLKTCSLDEDPITLHLTGGDITISLNPKNKTTMNRQQAKELLPIIQAFAEGKTVQTINENGEWINCSYINFEFNSSPNSYRIKPKPKYRPFKNKEECWEEIQKHQPFGWVTNDYGIYKIIIIHNKGALIQDIEGPICIFYSQSTRYKFADGTPFGIIDE